MTLRTKLIVVFTALALLPLVALSVVEYRAGASAVESLLRERAAGRTARLARTVEHVLARQDSRLLELAASQPLREYTARVLAERSQQPALSAAPVNAAAPPAVPDAVRSTFDAYFRAGREYLQSVTCLDPSGVPLFRVSATEGSDGVVFQTGDFVTGEVRYDAGVWSSGPARALRSQVSEESYGAALRITVPVAGTGESGQPVAAPTGAVVAELRLGDVVALADVRGGPEEARRNVVALDNNAGVVVYHTNPSPRHQRVAGLAPYFDAGLVGRMRAGESGSGFYDTADGVRWLASFGQSAGLGLSLASSENYAAALAPVRRTFLFGLTLALAIGLGGLALLLVTAGRETEDIERVAQGASAIAAGNLEQRVEVSATGETRGLAEKFNQMSQQLRDLIAHEAETRQFQSFLRISAMVSHDLKNAIAGLSMLVTNMERQFHREEFRADAIESLREATEKLKRTVARLSEPAKSLSGEYRIASRPTDLVPVIRRVLATNADPSRPLYDIEARLPEKLVATVEPDRIENVIENLVINALEAMGARGGRLTVEAGTLEGDLIFFSVSDTGVGMSEEFIRTRLFRPFSTTKNKGIGLGLFTCKEVVEAHGGRLEVDSRVGAGTRFRVVLPSRLFHSGERRERPVKATAAAQSALPGVPE